MENIESQLSPENPDLEEELFKGVEKYINQKNLRETAKAVNETLDDLAETFLTEQRKSDKNTSVLNPSTLHDLYEFWNSDTAEKIKKNFKNDARIQEGISTSEIERFNSISFPDEGFFERLIRNQIINFLDEKGLVKDGGEKNLVRKMYSLEHSVIDSANFTLHNYLEKLKALKRAPKVFEKRTDDILRYADIMMIVAKSTAVLAEATKNGFTKSDISRLAESKFDVSEIYDKFFKYRRRLIHGEVEDSFDLEVIGDHYKETKNHYQISDRYEHMGLGQMDHGYSIGSLFEKEKEALSRISRRITSPPEALKKKNKPVCGEFRP
jgi:hypothetical protein